MAGFEVRERRTSGGPRYDVVNVATGLPVVTWYNGAEGNEMVDFTDKVTAQAVVDQLAYGFLRDIRKEARQQRGER